MSKIYELNIVDATLQELASITGRLYIARVTNKNEQEYKTHTDSLKITIDIVSRMSVVSKDYVRRIEETLSSLESETNELKTILTKCNEARSYRNWIVSYDKIVSSYKRLYTIKKLMEEKISDIENDAFNFYNNHMYKNKEVLPLKDVKKLFFVVYNRNEMNSLQGITGDRTVSQYVFKLKSDFSFLSGHDEEKIKLVEKAVGKFLLSKGILLMESI